MRLDCLQMALHYKRKPVAVYKTDTYSVVFDVLYFPSTGYDNTWTLGTIKIPLKVSKCSAVEK